MWRFLFKATIFIMGMWVLLNGLGYIADSIHPQARWQAIAENHYADFLKRKDHLSAITIGNSHSAAIHFDSLNLEGQHLTIAGSDLFEMEKYIEHVIKEAPKLKVAFVSISYFSFNSDNASSNDSRILRVNLYAMLPTWTPIQGDAKNLILGKMQKAFHLMDVVRPDNWHGVVYNAFASSDSFVSSDSDKSQTVNNHPESLVITKNQCGHLTASDLDKMAYRRVHRQVMSALEEGNAHQNLPDDAFLALAKTIEALQTHNIRVILFTPPYSQAYNVYFQEQAPKMINTMYQSLALLQKKYHVEYYDFSNSLELVSRHEFFENSDHLNSCGNKAFSERLLKAMLASSNTED